MEAVSSRAAASFTLTIAASFSSNPEFRLTVRNGCRLNCVPRNSKGALDWFGFSSYIDAMARKPDLLKKTPEQKKAEAEQGLAEYRARQVAVNKNMERLRALRLAHEAANPPVEKPAPASRALKKKAVSKS